MNVSPLFSTIIFIPPLNLILLLLLMAYPSKDIPNQLPPINVNPN
jgi:hypothetical protein